MSTLPPLRQAVDRCGGIVAAALLLVLLATAPLRAAEDDPYSVTVSVDATGETSGKARDQARNDGERRAFATLAERLSGGAAPAKLPKLDDNALGDLPAIDAAKARAGDPTALAAIARRNGGEEAIVALATLRGAPGNPTTLEVAVRRYRGGQPVDVHTDTVAANPGERPEQLFRRAASQIATDIESGWKKGPLPRYDQQGRLTAVLSITGLEDWVRVRERLAALPAIRTVNLVTLSLQEATIELDYLGSIDQLKASLAEAKLDLVRGDPQGSPQSASMWRLARSGAPAR